MQLIENRDRKRPRKGSARLWPNYRTKFRTRTAILSIWKSKAHSLVSCQALFQLDSSERLTLFLYFQGVRNSTNLCTPSKRDEKSPKILKKQILKNPKIQTKNRNISKSEKKQVRKITKNLNLKKILKIYKKIFKINGKIKFFVGSTPKSCVVNPLGVFMDQWY